MVLRKFWNSDIRMGRDIGVSLIVSEIIGNALFSQKEMCKILDKYL